MLDPASVEEAMRGQEAVLCALGRGRFLLPTRILSEGTRNILRAMETHGARRLVCDTSLGIGDSAGRMGLYYTLFVIPVIPFLRAAPGVCGRSANACRPRPAPSGRGGTEAPSR